MSNEIFAKKKDKSSLVVSIIGMLIIIAVMAVAFMNAESGESDITGSTVKENGIGVQNDGLEEGVVSTNDL